MKNTTIRTLTSATLVTVLSMVAIPTLATPVFADGGLTCEVKTHEDGSTYTECTNTATDTISREQVSQVAQETERAWEQETGYTYGININEQSPAPVHTCRDDGYPEGYYWSESAQACVTDYVAPTVEPTPVTAPTTGGLTCEVKVNPYGSTYTECVEYGQSSSSDVINQTSSEAQKAWEQETGYTYGVNINDQTTKPTITPTATPKPTVNPTSTPTSTPSSTPVASTWNYTKVSTALLTLINNQRIANGVKPLSVVETAVSDATQRAMESMEYAKEVTAYGTTTDGHRGFGDDNWGDNEALGFEHRLTGSESEEDIAQAIFTSLTTGLTKKDSVFSDRYSNTAFGFTDAFFTRRNGNVLGYNVYYSLLLGK